MNKEQEKKSSEVDQLIGKYLEHKNALAELILDELEEGIEHSIGKIREYEARVERAFKALVSNQPESVKGCIRKLEFFADQISSEAEISNYHKDALKYVVEDFNRLVGKNWE